MLCRNGEVLIKWSSGTVIITEKLQRPRRCKGSGTRSVSVLHLCQLLYCFWQMRCCGISMKAQKTANVGNPPMHKANKDESLSVGQKEKQHCTTQMTVLRRKSTKNWLEDVKVISKASFTSKGTLLASSTDLLPQRSAQRWKTSTGLCCSCPALHHPIRYSVWPRDPTWWPH